MMIPLVRDTLREQIELREEPFKAKQLLSVSQSTSHYLSVPLSGLLPSPISHCLWLSSDLFLVWSDSRHPNCCCWKYASDLHGHGAHISLNTLRKTQWLILIRIKALLTTWDLLIEIPLSKSGWSLRQSMHKSTGMEPDVPALLRIQRGKSLNTCKAKVCRVFVFRWLQWLVTPVHTLSTTSNMASTRTLDRQVKSYCPLFWTPKCHQSMNLALSDAYAESHEMRALLLWSLLLSFGRYDKA